LKFYFYKRQKPLSPDRSKLPCSADGRNYHY